MFDFLLLAALVLTIDGQTFPLRKESVNIIGGTYVDIRNFPYQVAILQNNNLRCGGSILTKKWILSAAHCIKNVTEKLVVRAGSSFWARNGSLHQIEYYDINGREKYRDLSIMRVKEPFLFDETRQPIPLFTTNEVAKPGTMATISGWGLTHSPDVPNRLIVVSVPIVDQIICNKVYGDTLAGEITKGEICAGYMNIGGKDSCQGDSGGPLVINGRQAGIIAWGIGCGLPKYPGVYTSIAYYYEWIMHEIENHS